MANGTTNIGLVLKIGGVDKAITSIKEFNAVVKEAEDRLLTIGDKGSPEFQQLAADIANAKKQLGDFRKEATGTKVTKDLEKFVNVGGAISAAFGVASSALLAFGIDSEKAGATAKKVQNLINVAYGLNAIALQKDTLLKIKNTAVTIANTFATQGLIAGLRALWAAMLANPITAVLALLSALAVAFIALADDTDDAARANEAYARSVENNNAALARELQLMEAWGVSQDLIIKKRIENAIVAEKAALEIAKRAEAEGKSASEVNALYEKYFDAFAKRQAEEASLVVYYNTEKEKAEEKLQQQREKNAAKAAQQEKDRIAALEKEIALVAEVNRLELLRLNASQKFSNLNIEFILAKQNEEFIRLRNLLPDVTSLSEKWSKTFGDVSSQGQLALQALNAKLSYTKKLVGDGILAGLLTKEQGEAIINERTKYEANLELISKAFTSASTNISTTDFRAAVQSQLDVEQGRGLTFDKLLKSRQDYARLEQQFIADYVKNNMTLKQGEDGYQVALEQTTQTAKDYFTQLVETQKQTLLYDQAVDNLTDSFEDLREQNEKLREDGAAVTGWIQENRKLLVDALTTPISSFDIGRDKLMALQAQVLGEGVANYADYAKQIETIQDDLAAQGIDITKATEEEKMRILYEYLVKQDKARNEDIAKTYDAAKRGLDEFSNIINQYAEASAIFFETAFMALEKNYQNTLDNIVGDTKEANVLRAQAEEVYQKQLEELTLRQAKLNLKVTLAQAYANAAGAIIKVTEQTGIGAVFAASLVAGANAAQILAIQQQLRTLSMQRGGIIKAQGGMVVGPSHEYGGVKYAGGGIELEGGEAVINRNSTVQYAGLLSQINQLGGGKPITTNTFDDSRIVEAIASQRSEPIRAYVLESEITNKQGITRRLEQLSQI